MLHASGPTTATAGAATAKTQTAAALTAAQQADTQAAADLGKAQGAQAAQLAKVKADLDAIYGAATPTS